VVVSSGCVCVFGVGLPQCDAVGSITRIDASTCIRLMIGGSCSIYVMVTSLCGKVRLESFDLHVVEIIIPLVDV